MSEPLQQERKNRAEILAKQVLSLVEEFQCIGEREYETIWRKERYRECTDFVSGYETYHLYQPPTLLFETERVLSERLMQCLDALLESDIAVFGRVCHQSGSTTWPLRIIDRFGYKHWDDKGYSDIVELMGLLHPGQQGVLMAHAWDRLTDGTETKDRSLLNNLWARLPIATTLTISALIISDMIPGAFLSSFSNNARWQERQVRIHWVLDWLVSWMQIVRPSADDVVGKFVDYLYTPVNKEPLWAGYILAKKLGENPDPVIRQISENVQLYLLNLYPTYWVTDSGGLHFCGSLTVELIEETALAAAKLPQSELTAIFEHADIPSPQRLWRLRDVHDYQTYFNDVRKVLFHELLKISILNRIDETCKQGYIDKVLFALIQYGRQARYDHLSYDDKVLWRTLFKEISLFLVILNEDKQQEFVNAFTLYIDDLWLLIELERNMQEAGLAIKNNRILSMQVSKRQYLLSNLELTEVGELLYSIGEYQLAIQLLDMVDLCEFDGWKIAYWKRNKALCHIQCAMLSQDNAGQINELRSASSILQKAYQQEHSASKNRYTPLLLHVIGMLFDRDVFESTRLAHVFQSLRTLENMSQEHWIANAVTLLRLAKADDQRTSSWYQEFDMLCKNRGIHKDINFTQNLLMAWYFMNRANRALTFEEKAVLNACWEKETQEKQWLPYQLVSYIEGHTK